ncbi:MAG: hypothetical protein Q9194_002472 [Teloschistes cf. exilis]
MTMTMTSESSSETSNIEKGAEDLSTQTTKAPDGGLHAWLVVLGGFLTYFATFGLLNSFGIFQLYYQENILRNTPASTISWIGSIQLFLLFIGGIVVGPIFDSYGSRSLLICGTLIYVLSVMFTSLSTELYQFILAQGFMFGIGATMLFYPTISAISHWFDQKRGLALGIVVASSSIGGICWPFMLERLFVQIGFAWTVRTAGFMCLALLAPSCLLIKPRLPPRKSADVKFGAIKDSFADTRYVLLTAAMFFIFWGMFIPFYYLPSYGLAHGMSLYMSNNLLATLNAGSFAGRIVSGILADKLGRFNVTFICALCAGIILMCLHAIHTATGIIVFSVLYGFFSGGLISLQSACVAQITPDINMIGVKIGLLMAICSFGVLTGNPIGGALISGASGHFGGFIDFSGIILLFGAVLVLIARMTMDRKLYTII